MRESLLELYKEFLPSTRPSDHLDAVSFSMGAYAHKVWNDEERVVTTWDTHFNVRTGSTMITLHSIPNDVELVSTEAKMLLLREGIETFVKEVKLRMRKASDTPLYRREWLNPEELGSDFTGYFFYNIEPSGAAVFFIADCHRTLNFWIQMDDKGYPIPGQKRNHHAKKQLEVIAAIGKAVGTWLNRLKKLRKRAGSGALEKLLEDRGK